MSRAIAQAFRAALADAIRHAEEELIEVVARDLWYAMPRILARGAVTEGEANAVLTWLRDASSGAVADAIQDANNAPLWLDVQVITDSQEGRIRIPVPRPGDSAQAGTPAGVVTVVGVGTGDGE